jgi:uncharacterized protein
MRSPARVSMSRPADACPICGKTREARFRPFCSKRCKDLDLARWFSGNYSIPGAPTGEDNEPEPLDEDPELH